MRIKIKIMPSPTWATATAYFLVQKGDRHHAEWRRKTDRFHGKMRRKMEHRLAYGHKAGIRNGMPPKMSIERK